MPENKTDKLNEQSDSQEIDVEESFSNEKPEEADSIEITDDSDIKELLAEKEDKYLRLAAEFENYKKRMFRQNEELVHHAEAGVLIDLLEVLDNFERALSSAKDKKDFKAFKKGVKMIFGQMKKILDDHNVSQIDTVGKLFDPELHEAVMQIETDEQPEGVIAQELSGGYKKGKKVIRHAKVGVSSGKKNDNKNNESK
ncbi:MAG: nucleotide exchange factor GrpE [candidate division Zixibacteria bacterium]|nr:nucleotide exchange factor GrpE [candidate division Zixibacteria bacterium]